MYNLFDEVINLEFKPKYKRILVKLSGEAIGQEDGRGIDSDKLEKVVEQILELSKKEI